MAGAATIAMLETETMAHSRFSFQTDRCQQQQQQFKMCSNETISVVLAIESVIQVHEKQRLIENHTGK